MEFFVGRIFGTVEELKVALQILNEKTSSELTITTNNKKSVLIKCSHGISRKSKSSGLRPNQHHNYIGCTAAINCNKPRKSLNNEIRVTKVDLCHVNHDPNKEMRDRSNTTLTTEQEDLITTLHSANAQTSQIKRVLNERFKKQITTQKAKKLNE